MSVTCQNRLRLMKAYALWKVDPGECKRILHVGMYCESSVTSSVVELSQNRLKWTDKFWKPLFNSLGYSLYNACSIYVTH